MNLSRTVPLAFLVFLLAWPACGKKGSPFLHREEFSVRVVDLKAEWVKEYVFLKGKISGPGGLLGPKQAMDLVKGAKVYYGQYPLENPPCAGCPIKYHGFHGFGPEVLTEKGFLCKVPGKKKGEIYFFKVHLIGPEGAVGPTSERVRVVLE